MKRQIEKLTAEGKTKKKKRYREGWSIDRRNVHSVEEKYNLNVKTIKDETKKKKNSRVSNSIPIPTLFAVWENGSDARIFFRICWPKLTE